MRNTTPDPAQATGAKGWAYLLEIERLLGKPKRSVKLNLYPG